MNLKLLIDGILRQTTVLVAQLSTTTGIRSPLSHVADQVFLQLSRELESQGVRRAVAADMFGMALRSYQKKLQRLTESSSEQGRTLWQAVLEFVREHSPTRARILERFRHDSEREVGAVLHDLVSNGLVFVTGTGQHAVYGPTSDALQSQVLDAQDQEALANVIWLRVFQGEAATPEGLAASLGADPRLVERAVDELVASGRLSGSGECLVASNVVIPLGTTSGAEAAMLDHYRAVCKVLVRRAAALREPAAARDRGQDASRSEQLDGGSTFTFTVYPGHPDEMAVKSMLAEFRATTQALWERVAEYNRQHPPARTAQRIQFYLGQSADADEAATDLDPEDEDKE